MFGRAEERLSRIQENYASEASSTWLESLERSLAQLREYQVCHSNLILVQTQADQLVWLWQSSRKRLDNRRLAYDASHSKAQKAKKDDFKVEEELRVQKAKYEEASDDVYRRMHDIKDADDTATMDLLAFLEAQFSYYDRCREVLLQLKSDWPDAP